jgi:EAL domain-containing protein (putative c-di-GMP-specific phosphodiesterase class I)
MAMVRLRPAELKQAIEAGMLTLHFQPQVRVSNGNLEGVEGFVRWPHPAYGLVGPGDIIALVEAGGLHESFDRWVVRAACEQSVRWAKEGVQVPLIAVNVWAQSLKKAEIVDAAKGALRDTGADPARIELESPRGAVTEKAFAKQLAALRKLGVRLASEDLAAATKPKSERFDTVKVPFPTSRDVEANAKLIGAVVEACRASGARVVADSVETPAQEAALAALGVEIVQGYLYGPEVAPGELKTLLSRQTVE